jgi:hypothetical protein
MYHYTDSGIESDMLEEVENQLSASLEEAQESYVWKGVG